MFAIDTKLTTGPFNEQLVKPLYLKNTTDSKLAYKIKTTAPKLYSVRPNASVVEPGQTVEVAITRQARDPPHPDEKPKDKFLILSMPVRDIDPSADFTALWSHLEENFKDQIQNRKIRVHYQFNNTINEYQQATGASAGQAGHAGPESGISESSAAGSGVGSGGAAAAAGAAGGAAAGLAAGAAAGSGHNQAMPIGPVGGASNVGDDSLADRSINDFSTPQKSAPLRIPQDQAPISSSSTSGADAGSSTGRSTGTSGAGLTSRSTADSKPSSSAKDSSAGAAVARAVRPASTGVPIHIVVAIALLTFFVGWKFF